MTPQTFQLTVYGHAQPAGSKTAGVTRSGRRYIRDANPRSQDWKHAIAAAAGAKVGPDAPLIHGPVTLHIRFYRPRPQGHYGANGIRPSAKPYPTTKPDATKLLRAVEDALTGIVWNDDAQVVHQVVEKLYGNPPRAEISAGPYEPAMLEESGGD